VELEWNEEGGKNTARAGVDRGRKRRESGKVRGGRILQLGERRRGGSKARGLLVCVRRKREADLTKNPVCCESERRSSGTGKRGNLKDGHSAARGEKDEQF